jgi:hypothetical protein
MGSVKVFALMTFRKRVFAMSLLSAATTLTLGGCAREGDLVVDQGVGITAVLSPCPAVGIPDYTGDVTVFRNGGSAAFADLDMAASLTNLRSTCDDTGEKVYTEANFDVRAQRRDVRGARTITLPYFVTVLQGGSAVVSKRVGEVTLTFADGADRAQASARAGSFIERSAASLPEDIRERITRRRRPGDPEAALDPLAAPEVRAAIARTRFEMLIGFQLSEDQLAYNATR